MWLSNQIIKDSTNKTAPVMANITQNDAAKISAQEAVEYREINSIVPFGIAYSPLSEQDVAVLPIGSNNYCIGVKMEDKNLSPGDLMLYSGNTASILIKSDGSININGDVKINGVSLET